MPAALPSQKGVVKRRRGNEALEGRSAGLALTLVESSVGKGQTDRLTGRLADFSPRWPRLVPRVGLGSFRLLDVGEMRGARTLGNDELEDRGHCLLLAVFVQEDEPPVPARAEQSRSRGRVWRMT